MLMRRVLLIYFNYVINCEPREKDINCISEESITLMIIIRRSRNEKSCSSFLMRLAKFSSLFLFLSRYLFCFTSDFFCIFLIFCFIFARIFYNPFHFRFVFSLFLSYFWLILFKLAKVNPSFQLVNMSFWNEAIYVGRAWGHWRLRLHQYQRAHLVANSQSYSISPHLCNLNHFFYNY